MVGDFGHAGRNVERRIPGSARRVEAIGLQGLRIGERCVDECRVRNAVDELIAVDSVRASRDGQSLRIVSSRAMVFSNDGGISWQWHDLPLDSGGVIRLEFPDPSTALAVAATGLYISHDAGTTWRRAQSGLPQAPVSDLFIGPQLWLASIAPGGLYLSQDQGANWARIKNRGPLKETIEDSQFQALLGERDEGLILAGSATEGLYVLDLASPTAVASAQASGK